MLYLVNPQKYIKKNKEQLWQEDHKTFYWWIGALFISLLIIITILITMLSIFIMDKKIIFEKQVEWTQQSSTATLEEIRKAVEKSLNIELVVQVLFIVVFMCALGLLIHSFWKSLKSKTFSTLSVLPTGIVFFLGFSSFFNFISLIGQSISELLALSNYYILNFIVIKIVYLLVWFLVSRNVAIIRRLFIRLENIEKFESVIGKKIYEEPLDSSQSNPSTTTKTTADSKKEDDPIYQRLNSLEEKGLHQIARELSISGYDNMDKTELLNIIYSIYKNLQKPEKNEEIEIETINNKETKDDEIK